MKTETRPAATYLVTGANRGIGLEFVRQLSERGDRVIATARHPETAEALAQLGAQIEPLDVAEAESVAVLSKRMAERPIDVLIHNAAIGAADSGLARLSMEDVERNFRVNALGPLRLTQALLPNLRAGRRKMIVGITSGLGSVSDNTSGGWYAYRASKAALNQLLRTIAAELAPEKFTCVGISPGWVRTEMGGAGARLSPERSVRGMLAVLDRLKPSATSQFFDWQGGKVAW